MKLNLIILFILFCTFQLKAQSYQYSYTDPCTGVIKTLTVPINGTVSVYYYGSVGTFTSSAFYDGTFETWCATTVNSYQGVSPCSQTVGINTAVNVTQGQTLNTLSILSSLSAVSDMAGSTNILGGATSTIGGSNGGGSSNKSDKNNGKSNGNTGSNTSNGNNGNSQPNNTSSSTQTTSGESTSSQNAGSTNGSTGSGSTTNPQSTESTSGSQSTGGTGGEPTGSQSAGSTGEGSASSSEPQGTTSSGGEVSSTGSGETTAPGTTTSQETGGSSTESNTGSTTANPGGEGSPNGGSSGETTQETPTQAEEAGGQTNITAGGTQTVKGSTTTSNGKGSASSKSSKAPSVVASSDFVGFNFKDSDVDYGAKVTGGYTSVKWDGSTSYGILADYTSALKGPNITGFHAWIKPKAITLLSATATIGFDGRGSLYGTLSGGQMRGFKGKYLKPLKIVYMGTVSYGHVFKSQFIGTALIAGGMYDIKIGKRIDIKLMALGVYAPYVSYYNDLLLKSPFVALPSIGVNIGITRKFKFNINGGGSWALGQSTLNYTVTCGTRLLIGE